jgi:hypothetical protein
MFYIAFKKFGMITFGARLSFFYNISLAIHAQASASARAWWWFSKS